MTMQSTRLRAAGLASGPRQRRWLSCARARPGHVRNPEEAVQAIADLARTGDAEKVEELFGAGVRRCSNRATRPKTERMGFA
jgi:hypothetical protein